MDKITVRLMKTSRVSQSRSEGQWEMLFIWLTNGQQLLVALIVPSDNEHLLSIGSSKKVYIYSDSVLSDMSPIAWQLSHGFHHGYGFKTCWWVRETLWLVEYISLLLQHYVRPIVEDVITVVWTLRSNNEWCRVQTQRTYNLKQELKPRPKLRAL